MGKDLKFQWNINLEDDIKSKKCGGKILLRGLSLILILLVNLALAAEGGEGDLFSRMRINPIKGDKKAGFFFKGLDR